MIKVPRFLSAVAVLLLGSTSLGFAGKNPLLTVDVQSYDQLLADVGKITSAAGQDASMVEIQMQMMVGQGLLALVDGSKPWHAAVWMESLEATPVVAVVLPVSDFEGFEAALQRTMIGQMGAQLVDLDGAVALFGSSPGVPLADSWSALVVEYAKGLNIVPNETIEISLEMSEQIRQAAIASLALPKAQMMAAFDGPEIIAQGIAPEAMKSMMEGYFTFYETMLKETNCFDFGLGVSEENIDLFFDILPIEGTGFAELVASQKVDISDIASSVDFGSGLTMIMGIDDLPESWNPLMEDMMKGMMPLYGLEEGIAKEWMEAMQLTLPIKAVYNMGFGDGMNFSGFYDILDASAQEVYDQWLSFVEGLAVRDGLAQSYYSEINIEKGYRTVKGNPIDRVELVINQDHPTMSLEGQKEAMEAMFKDGKLVYEMAIVGSRIYMSGAEDMEQVMSTKASVKAPVGIGPNTRFYGSMDFVELLKFGAGFSAEAMPPALAAIKKGDAVLTYLLETDEALKMKVSFPLGLLEAL